MSKHKGDPVDDWSEKPLGSFAAPEPNSFVDGPFGSDLKVSDYSETGVRILQLQNLGDGYFIDDNVKFASESKALSLARCMVRPGDLVIAKMAEPLARACIVPATVERGLIVADLMKLRLAKEHDATFICSAINGPKFRREAERLSTGTTRTRISLSTLKRIKLNAPGPDLQRKIGQIVQALDDAMEQTEALIQKLQQMKAGLMHDLFTRGVTPDGHLRPTREEAPHLYHETPLGWIPREWEVKSCSGICLAVIDCKNRTPPVTDDGHPVIRTPNVRNGEFVWSDLAYTDPASYVTWTARGRPQSGDIVITREAPVGEVCMIPDEVFAPCLGQRMMLYRPDPDRVNGCYMLHVIQSQRVQKHLDVISGGSTVGHVKVGDIRNLRLPLPLLHEQLIIVKSIEATRAQIRSLSEHLAKLRQQKQGLMQDLLTGRVPVIVATNCPK